MTNPDPKKKDQKPAPKIQDESSTLSERINLLFGL